MHKIKRKYIHYHLRLKKLLRVIVLPGFDGMPLYDVLVFFFRGLFKGVLTYRASAIAYNFFLALIPFIMFLFTLIPFVTGEHYQTYLLDLIQELIPANIYSMVKNTVEEIISRPHQGLLSAGFFMAIYFATNGVDAILEGFNQSYHAMETRPWWKQKLVAFGLMLILSVLLFISFVLLGFGELSIRLLTEHHLLTSDLSIFSLQLLRWIIILFFTFLSTSLLYYFGQLKTGKEKVRYRFFSAGSILATSLFIVGGIIIKLYFENFSRYNILYGSIGSLIILLVWIYYNAFIILIGFELNTSIRRSRLEALKKKDEQIGR
ncbi:YihY/virulence factor BrkB family protein [Candidatus Sulfidibacterium hydrothermale]|uniref:YihY/virulence factor BrkB family protein n=1 Tax=Candidatus Sulfidibacterium hydrothermale TaxID=2875962 RepID=UPI001F0A7B97|nr:YihY/virulence factor BrkB family protein [Candidatus Sulfidibacterium hydrothermale]UBM61656.1 YihY/virulence factor BrkB family protein [Candidatus Sulfidibacterium hydrothermale]